MRESPAPQRRPLHYAAHIRCPHRVTCAAVITQLSLLDDSEFAAGNVHLGRGMWRRSQFQIEDVTNAE